MSIGSAVSLSGLHDYPIIFLFVLMGILCALGLFACYLFRVLAEVVDAYYDFRAKCVVSKQRFQQVVKERQTG